MKKILLMTAVLIITASQAFCAEKWHKLTDDMIGVRMLSVMKRHNDMLFVIGGQRGSDFLNDVWRSKDGENWECVNAHAPFAPRAAHAVFSVDGRLWVVGGRDNKKAFKDAWYTEDMGTTWKKAAIKKPYTPKFSFWGFCVHKGMMYLVSGNDKAGATAGMYGGQKTA